MKINYLWVLIAVLAIFNGLFIYKYRSLQKQLLAQQVIAAGKSTTCKLLNANFPDRANLFPVSNNLNNDLSAQIRSRKLTLLVLFEPTQCGSCLGETALWNQLYQAGQLQVLGVTADKDIAELKQYLIDSHTNIPVYSDSTASIGKWFMPERLPVKILVDKNLNVLLVDYVRETDETRNQFREGLNAYLENAGS